MLASCRASLNDGPRLQTHKRFAVMRGETVQVQEDEGTKQRPNEDMGIVLAQPNWEVVSGT